MVDEDASSRLRSELRTAARDWTVLYQAEGRRPELLMAVDTFRWLHRSAGQPGARAAAGADLLVALQFEFERSGELASIDEAIELAEVAVREATSGSRRTRQESNLGNALRLRFEATGERSDLERAVRHARQGLDPTASGVVQAQRLSNLALLLRVRYELLDRRPDLDEAVVMYRRARASAGAAEPQRGRIASNLSVAVRLQGTADRDAEALGESAELALESANSPDGFAIDRPGFLINAGLAYTELSKMRETQPNLERAQSLLRLAIEASTPGETDHRIALINLARVARARAAGAGTDRMLLDEAVERSADVISMLTADDPEAVGCWAGLGRAYWLRFERLGDAQDARQAISARLVAAGQRFGSPGQRTMSGRIAGEWAMSTGDSYRAVRGYALALEQLRALIWPGLDRAERERRLADLSGLAVDAAAAGTAARLAPLAVVFAEAGRSVLWDDQLEVPDLERLAAVHPAQAGRLVEIRRRMDVLEVLRTSGAPLDESP